MLSASEGASNHVNTKHSGESTIGTERKKSLDPLPASHILVRRPVVYGACDRWPGVVSADGGIDGKLS